MAVRCGRGGRLAVLVDGAAALAAGAGVADRGAAGCSAGVGPDATVAVAAAAQQPFAGLLGGMLDSAGETVGWSHGVTWMDLRALARGR